MKYKILSINPGSTSTKIALYENEKELFSTTIAHTDKELAVFSDITEQYDFRKSVVLKELENQGYNEKELDAVVGRGGLFANIKAGGYIVNDTMKEAVLSGKTLVSHASNLGCLIADAIAKPLNISAYIYDCVSSDEMDDIARITGLPEVQRISTSHVLNSKAVSREVAKKYNKKYEDMNFIVAHLGGGISITAHKKGRLVDVIADDQGPFSPERVGVLPTMDVIKICYSGKYSSQKEFMKLIRSNAGLKAHLGTNDCIEIIKRIENGDTKAKDVFTAMAYQISRSITSLSPALKYKIDAVILTGGISKANFLTDIISDYLGNFAKVEIVAGEKEMESLTLGTLRILNGEEQAKEYI